MLKLRVLALVAVSMSVSDARCAADGPRPCPAGHPGLVASWELGRGRATAWTCDASWGDGTIAVFVDRYGAREALGTIATSADCTTITPLQFHTSNRLVCIEYATSNAGCELPVPAETWLACFEPGPHNWSRDQDRLLERRELQFVKLEGVALEHCLATTQLVDSCARASEVVTVPRRHVTFSATGSVVLEPHTD